MNIVVLDGYTLNPGDNPWSGLSKLGHVTVHHRTFGEEVVSRAESADVLVVNKVRMTSDRISRLPRLRFISVTATGYDCVDVSAAAAAAIPVSNVPVYGTDSVAQFSFSLVLELCHRVSQHDAAVRKGEWARRNDFSFCLTPQIELAGLTMGIVGHGRIGGRVAKIAGSFGMRVLAHTRSPDSPAPRGISFVSLPQLVAESDVISFHCPLTDATREMVNAGFLGQCKPNLLLINASRGALVDEQALADALHQGTIAGAAVDVASSEPIEPDNPLLQAPNCIITPHMAWATLAARRRLMQTTVDNVSAFKSGTPQHVVNRNLLPGAT